MLDKHVVSEYFVSFSVVWLTPDWCVAAHTDNTKGQGPLSEWCTVASTMPQWTGVRVGYRKNSPTHQDFKKKEKKKRGQRENSEAGEAGQEAITPDRRDLASPDPFGEHQGRWKFAHALSLCNSIPPSNAPRMWADRKRKIWCYSPWGSGV